MCERRFEDLAEDKADDDDVGGNGNVDESLAGNEGRGTPYKRVNNSNRGAGFADEEEALKHFTLLVHAACENARMPSLAASSVKDMFSECVLEGRSPFHLWDDWIHAELSKRRYVGGLVVR